jgi:uncharacterized membrane protein YhaH (DUF805 family)
MNFIEAVKACFQKYASFSGRATRSEYWWFALFQAAAQIVALMISETLFLIVALALLLPALAVGARRLHDIGKSGWLQLVWLVPAVGWAFMIYWFVQPSGGGNQYGSQEVTPDSPTVMPGQ